MSLSKLFGKSVVVGVSFSVDWENVVAHACDFARAAGCGVHLVNVLEKPPSVIRRSFDTKALRDLKRHQLEEAKGRLEKAVAGLPAGTRGSFAIVEGDPAETILDIAQEAGAGLVVCGVGYGRSTGAFAVGPNTERLVRHSKVPVLVIGAGMPRRLKRILVPTDFDRPDQGALRVASELAIQHKGTVLAVHATAVPSLLRGYLGDTHELRKAIVAEAKKQLAAFVASTELPPGARPVKKVLNTTTDSLDAAAAVVKDAERLEIDLIVMALGRRHLFSEIIIGSTAEQILRNLPRSLLALPEAWARKR